MRPTLTKKRRWLAIARWNSRVYVWLAPMLTVAALIGTTLIGVALQLAVAGFLLAALAAVSQILQNWWSAQEALARYTEAVDRHTALADQLDPIARTIAQMPEQSSADREGTFQRVVTQATNSILFAIENVRGLRAVVYDIAPDGKSMQVVHWTARTHRLAPTPFLLGTERGDAAFQLLQTGEALFVPNIAAAPDEWAGSGNGYNTFISCPINSPVAAYGLLTVDAVNTDDLTEDDLVDIRLVAGILANAFAERVRTGTTTL